VSDLVSEGIYALYSPRGSFSLPLLSIAIIAGGYHCAHRQPRSPLAARSPRRVAELAQLGYQAVTMLTLDLDDALPDGTARAA